MIFYSVILLFTVTWVLITIIIKYDKYYISNKYINHNILNLMLTRVPVLILIVFTFNRLIYNSLIVTCISNII